jgi:transcriptional repressor NrdR
MLCPYCGHSEQRVLDSRPAREGEAIRRRRECEKCGRRFTTFEEPERTRLFVIKRDGSRAEFSRDKVLAGMIVACHKRPVSIEQLREAAEKIERDLFQEFETEVPSTEIGERVVESLRRIDTVAFVRFASVYREFQTVSDFREIVESCREEPISALT